jgi:hypothetical protein
MGKFGNDAPQVAVGRDLWDETNNNPAGRPADGGSGAPSFPRQVEQAGYPGQEHPGKGDPLAAGEHGPGGDLFDGRPGHGLSGV